MHTERSFQANTHVNIALDKWHICAFRRFVVLHEDIIANFYVFTASATRLAIGAVLGASCVVEEFRVWTAWTCLAFRWPPVVLFRQVIDTLLRNTQLQPYLYSFVITGSITITCKNCD